MPSRGVTCEQKQKNKTSRCKRKTPPATAGRVVSNKGIQTERQNSAEGQDGSKDQAGAAQPVQALASIDRRPARRAAAGASRGWSSGLAFPASRRCATRGLGSRRCDWPECGTVVAPCVRLAAGPGKGSAAGRHARVRAPQCEVHGAALAVGGRRCLLPRLQVQFGPRQLCWSKVGENATYRCRDPDGDGEDAHPHRASRQRVGQACGIACG